MAEDKIRIDYIIRSLDFGRKLGRFEGLFPLKHIGIMVTNNGDIEVYHVQNTSKLGIVGHIKIKPPCSLDEFSSGLAVKSIINRAVDQSELAQLKHWINAFDDKPYIFAVLDCERVASIAYRKGITRFLFHRQVWLMFALVTMVHSVYNSILLIFNEQSRFIRFDLCLYGLGIAIAFVFLIYFFFFLNNTSYRQIKINS